MLVYDEVIIGSGPSAFAYCAALDTSGKKVLLVSSSAIKATDSKELKKHVKLSLANGKTVIDLNSDQGGFYITSALGGLSNSWGGVLCDPSHRDYEDTFGVTVDKDSFLSAKSGVIKNIKRYKKLVESQCDSEEGYFVIEPSNEFGWENAELCLYEGLKDICDIKSVEILESHLLTSFSKSETGFELCINEQSLKEPATTSSKVFCNRLILAAGTPGNLTLLTGSHFSKVIDHSPYQVAGIDIKSVLLQKPCFPIINTFNSPIAGILSDDDQIFAIYAPDRLSKPFLQKVAGAPGLLLKKLGKFQRHINLVQVWNSKTYSNAELSFFSRLKNIISILFKMLKSGFIPLKVDSTPVGQGFHYASNIRVNDMDSVVILGGAMAKELPIYHPTFLFMIDAYLKGSSGE